MIKSYSLRTLLTLSSILAIICFIKVDAVDIAKEIMKDMMTPVSSKCQASPGTFSTSFSFESSQAKSNWNPDFVKYEDGLFLAKLQHTDNSNSDQEWTIRIGQAGNIYSFYGPMGETVPPQRSEKSEMVDGKRQYYGDSPWVDEVWQQVSPIGNSGDHDNDLTTDKYFIHEAGTYTRDPPYCGVVKEDYDGKYAAPEGSTPFYSPTLGKYCDEQTGECGFLSWGVQAHVPTDWESPMIYLNRYTDCGGGVIEYTSARHSNGEEYCDGNPDKVCPFVYLNVPWGGTRSTVLKDMVMTNSDNSYDHIYPIGSWGSAKEISDIKPLSDTAGYTVFSEDLPHADDGNVYALPANVQYTFKSKCSISSWHTLSYGQLVVLCQMENTQSSNTGETQQSIRLVTDNNGCSIAMYRVMHFANGGKRFYFYPEIASGETQAQTVTRINSCFTSGTKVTGVFVNKPGKPPSQNRALAHVHGTGTHNSNRQFPRVRTGYSPSRSRQYNVYTVNDLININDGDTYIANQYFIMDNYEEMSSKGPEWSAETNTVLKTRGDYSNNGRTVSLYQQGGSFGATIESNTCGNFSPTCVGSTTPKPGVKALFLVQCGESKVVTDDPYHFTPSGIPVRAYACDGLDPTVRPTWILLGFFESGACGTSLNSRDYDPDFCTNPSVPSGGAHGAGAHGDPHIKMWTGERYDFQGACDLVLLQNHAFANSLGMFVHIRTAFTRSWSYVSSTVVLIGNETLEVMGGTNHRYWINKVEGMDVSRGISGFPITHRTDKSYQTEFIVKLIEDEKSPTLIVMKTFHSFVSVSIEGAKADSFGDSTGLMGSWMGEKIARDNTTTIFDNNKFGLEWQVLTSEPKLFHNIEGVQSPQTCALQISSNLRRRLGESQYSFQDAKIACSHVPNEGDRDACIYDVLMTSDNEIAGTY